jgi:hypothetical protein
MMDICLECTNEAVLGSSGLCSSCWWRIAAWPSCRPALTDEERTELLFKKEGYGIKDVR